MAKSDALAALNFQTVVQNMGTGLLIFDAQDKLILDNPVAQQILGPNLVLMRSEGWSAFAMLTDANRGEQPPASEIRAKAIHQATPIRFHMLLSGVNAPCWASSMKDDKGKVLTIISIERPDWHALMELMGTFRAEARSAITSTSGHADFVRKLLNNPPKKTTVEDLGKRAMGMIDVISSQMHRLQLLIDLLHRLEIIRTGQLPAQIEQRSTIIQVADFIEDFVEELSEEALVDPNIAPDAYRDRLVLDVDDKLKVKAPKTMLRDILRDVLRNAFMYSEAPSPVKLRVFSATQGRHVQFDVNDEGCGIRAKEADRVFQPFQRARQPQVIREYGYGLALYLCKSEVEAMGGRIWYESEEGVGTTFSFKLPAAE